MQKQTHREPGLGSSVRPEAFCGFRCPPACALGAISAYRLSHLSVRALFALKCALRRRLHRLQYLYHKREQSANSSEALQLSVARLLTTCPRPARTSGPEVIAALLHRAASSRCERLIMLANLCETCNTARAAVFSNSLATPMACGAAAPKQEHFRILFLDKGNHLIADEQHQTGTVDHTPVYPREVVKRALELSATAVILVHNHPSGDPTPSRADIEMTRAIVEVARPLGIAVHDHLIVGKDGHASLKALKLM